MALQSFYKEVMELNGIQDMTQREIQAQAFFKNLNSAELPQTFNWAQEIFEDLHVKERGDQLALIWADLHTDEHEEYTYTQLAENGNKMLNYLRKNGAEKGDNLYMLTPHCSPDLVCLLCRHQGRTCGGFPQPPP